MLMQYQTTFTDKLRPMEAYDALYNKAMSAHNILQFHGMFAASGLPELVVPQLAQAAQEPHIVETWPYDFSPRPNEKPGRFDWAEHAEQWLGKGRDFVGIYDKKTSSLLAYGASGPEKNKVIKGADITTMYRVTSLGGRIARERMLPRTLGILLGEIIIDQAVNEYGNRPPAVSLETWHSDTAAVRAYDALRFTTRKITKPEFRPTLQPLGSPINGFTVERDPITGGNRVLDRRVHMQLLDTPDYGNQLRRA